MLSILLGYIHSMNFIRMYVQKRIFSTKNIKDIRIFLDHTQKTQKEQFFHIAILFYFSIVVFISLYYYINCFIQSKNACNQES